MKVALLFRNPRMIAPYEDALRMAGLEPVHVTPAEPKPLNGLAGLVLTGGSDINPARYCQSVSGSEGVDDDRDRLETEYLLEALAADLPVFAICRGMQLLNVVHGGSLIQHLPATDLHRTAHSVSVSPGTKLAALIGAGAHDVNSRHHQAADRVGTGLIVSAVAMDGVIEGLERLDKRFVVGVQWHPEDLVQVSEADRNLFVGFASAVRK